jgi:hypothetical protein
MWTLYFTAGVVVLTIIWSSTVELAEQPETAPRLGDPPTDSGQPSSRISCPDRRSGLPPRFGTSMT